MKSVNYRPAARLALAVGLVTSAGLCLPAVTRAQNADAAASETEAVTKPVSYSSEQADRGEEKYESDCEECHGDDLKGGLNGGAPLRGMAFEQKYVDEARASWMFDFMSSQMPPNAPGRYSESTYADLMAYILKKNGFQPGAELPSDVDALDNLTMEK